MNVIPEDFVKEQLKSVLSDMHPDVVSSFEHNLFVVYVFFPTMKP